VVVGNQWLGSATNSLTEQLDEKPRDTQPGAQKNKHNKNLSVNYSHNCARSTARLLSEVNKTSTNNSTMQRRAWAVPLRV
jgi:hypothetical protein